MHHAHTDTGCIQNLVHAQGTKRYIPVHRREKKVFDDKGCINFLIAKNFVS